MADIDVLEITGLGERNLRDNRLPATTAQNQGKVLEVDNSGNYALGNAKLDKENPTGTGSFSLNRKANTTIGENSVALGSNTTASGRASLAEGIDTKASGFCSHAEGGDTIASGGGSHAEGGGTTASGIDSHAEGTDTTASGGSSHAEGNKTKAKGYNSHAQGDHTIAHGASQHVFGEYNIEDDSNGEDYDERGAYVEIVGNGESSARSNARTLDWDGNETIAGDLTFNGNTSLTTALGNKENTIPRLTGTLTAGQTSITISSASIVDGSFLEYFVSDPSVPILDANPTVGSVTLTFEAQASDLGIGVVVL